MPKDLYIYSGESNLLSPINHIRFWEKGEMAYSALKKINELKAKNEFEKADIILSEWIFQMFKGKEMNKIFWITPKGKLNFNNQVCPPKGKYWVYSFTSYPIDNNFYFKERKSKPIKSGRNVS